MRTIHKLSIFPSLLALSLTPLGIGSAEEHSSQPKTTQSTKVAADVEAKTQLATRAAEVLDEIMKTPDQSIPVDLLSRAKCVAVFPATLKAGFVVGAQYGYGLVSCRQQGADPWGAPAFFTLTGGSVGFQIGAKATDLILLVMNEEAQRELLDARVTLGAGLGVSAGPVGRDASAATDVSLQASILSYSRSEGLFAGVDLGGSVLNYDTETTKEIYGHEWDVKTVLAEPQDTIPALQVFSRTIQKYAPQQLS
ncbi:MAG: lipid-binding SYLF domain-containing protein [Candidatus Binatia bacterium]